MAKKSFQSLKSDGPQVLSYSMTSSWSWLQSTIENYYRLQDSLVAPFGRNFDFICQTPKISAIWTEKGKYVQVEGRSGYFGRPYIQKKRMPL